jgi:carboxypeptidase family protein
MRSRVRPSRCLTLLTIAGAMAATDAHAQTLLGTVRDSSSGVPIPGAVVTLLDSAAGIAARTTTDEGGQFRAVLIGAGVRALRVVRLGFRPRTVTLPAARDGVIRVDVPMTSIPMSMQSVNVTAGPGCPRRPDRAQAAAVLEQARAGLLATVVARSDKPAHMTRLRATRFWDMVSNQVVHQRVRIDSSGTPFGSFGAARSAADFVRLGFRADSAGLERYYGPDAEVLLDDRFTSAYCFHLAAAQAGRPNQIGLGFRPPNRRNGRIDVDGTIWIDTLTRALVEIEYLYLGTDPRGAPFRPGGRIEFRTMPNGVVVIDRWSIRLVSGQGAGGIAPVGPELASRSFYGIEGVGELARATWADGYTWLGPLGTLHLRVVRSDGRPVPGAVVRLMDTDYEAASDLNGDLHITDLVPGRYVVTRVDPELIAIGVPVDTLLEFAAGRGRTLITRIKVPEIRDYVGDRCGDDDIVARLTDERYATRASLYGRVTSADGQALPTARWSLWTGKVPNLRRVVNDASVDDNGIFHYCALRLGDTVVVEVKAKGLADANVPIALVKQPTVIGVQMRPRGR